MDEPCSKEPSEADLQVYRNTTPEAVVVKNRIYEATTNIGKSVTKLQIKLQLYRHEIGCNTVFAIATF